jgi:hypothetical protein
VAGNYKTMGEYASVLNDKRASTCSGSYQAEQTNAEGGATRLGAAIAGNNLEDLTAEVDG